MTRLELRRQVAADAPTVWQALADHEGMISWSPLTSVALRVEGAPDRNGMGAIRVMKGAGPTIEEEVIAWDPPHSYDYRLLKGAPIRNHRGRVIVRPRGEGAEVTWSISFQPLVPGTGWILRVLLRRVIGGMLRRLAGQLEQRAPGL